MAMNRKRGGGASNADLLQILTFGNAELTLEMGKGALARRPADAKLWQLLGVANLQLGRLREAQALLSRALELRPADGEISANLAAANRLQADRLSEGYVQALADGDAALAERLARQAVALDASNGVHHNALATALTWLGRKQQAIDAARRAVSLAPGMADFHFNLGGLLRADGQTEAAIDSFRQALALRPGDMQARGMLAEGAAQLGRFDEAIEHLRGGQARWPEQLPLLSQLVFCRTALACVPVAELFEDHVEYGRRAVASAVSAGPHERDRDPERRLRLGFVSGDLHHHPVAGFIEPVWAALDRSQCEVWVYANQKASDAVTERLKAWSTHWADVVALDDAELAARIQADRIDVLFDLSGHTAAHRLPCFAMKPAPVQATWIGYPNTTGLPTMDYALCDRFNAPPGLYEAYYTEKFARIPCSGTFTPLVALPGVAPLPAAIRGHVMFCSFNQPRKIGAPVLRAWARVLHAVPSSRLLIGNVAEPEQVERMTRELSMQGVDPARLSFKPPMDLTLYLTLHHEADIMLDSWPYTGGTTTNYALAMGVPVVTLQGPGRSHCQSAGVLGRIGLQDWVARSEDEFVDVARRWADDLPALAEVRAGLRARWQDTPLRQPASVARGLEGAVRTMWRRWCAGLPPEHFDV